MNTPLLSWRMYGRIVLTLLFIFSLTSLSAEPLDAELLSSADTEAREADNLKQNGQTVKANKLEKSVAARLSKYFKAGKRYSLPSECQFTYMNSHLTLLGSDGKECALSGSVWFAVDTNDQKMLEKLEECTNSPCTGEFVLVPDYAKKLFTLFAYQNPTIWVTVKFRSVKQVQKPAEQ